MPRHPSFLLKIKITILDISLSLSFSLSLSPSLILSLYLPLSLSLSLYPSLSLSLSLFIFLSLSLPPSFSHYLPLSLSLSPTGEDGLRTIEIECYLYGANPVHESDRERGREREQKVRACSKHFCRRALSIPHSVSQSACVIIILNIMPVLYITQTLSQSLCIYSYLYVQFSTVKNYYIGQCCGAFTSVMYECNKLECLSMASLSNSV